MGLPQPVSELLDVLISDIQDTQGHNLVGVYLRGSLALGDFIPETSDIDVLAVMERPVTEAEFDALAAMHARLAALSHPYARRLEIAYIDRAALWRFEVGRRHPTLGQGEMLGWTEHRDNWILERWTIRERGVTLLGPDPRALIAAISSDGLIAATRSRLRDWLEWAEQPDDPDWLLPRSHKAYVIETMCRALCALAGNGIQSKPAAVAWALETLPEPFLSTVERSKAWRADPTPDPAILPEVSRFVRWAASESTAL